MSNDVKRSPMMRGLQPFGLWDWVLARGAFGFGTLTALLSLLYKIYKGQPPTWPEALQQTIVWVFVAGPLWGLWMWWKRHTARRLDAVDEQQKTTAD